MTFGPASCSIIHRHSRLTHAPKKRGEGGEVAEGKIKITREKKVEGLMGKTGTKTLSGTNLNNVTI